jgi:hypothetical protein
MSSSFSRKTIEITLSKNYYCVKDKNFKKIKIEFDLVFLVVISELKKITSEKKMV